INFARAFSRAFSKVASSAAWYSSNVRPASLPESSRPTVHMPAL
ncbi:hypothetical protein D030_0112B, partial [Vibrio parahaemolyticus AQ3810]